MVTYREQGSSGIVEFNDQGSKVNLLSRKNLEEIEAIINNLAGRVKTLFFVSKKQGLFIAGADIKELARIRTKEDILGFCKKTQDLFSRIEGLKIQTCAIVDGACVGGGLELALSCKHILATRNKNTVFGLPEVKIGISPGFGGPHRLREKIGAIEAGRLIDSGMMIDAGEALALKMIDRIIPDSKKGSYRKLAGLCLERQKGAVDIGASKDKVEREERKLVAEKIFEAPARNALESYLLVDKYRNHRWPEIEDADIYPIQNPLVIGAGTMGKGIAYLINSQAGLSVRITDSDKCALKRSGLYIKGMYKDAVERNMISWSEAEKRSKKLLFGKGPSRDTSLIIESITEDALAKKSLLADIEHGVSKDCIIATNTSCISIEELSKSLKNASRFLGLHFFNPAYKMKLVEVVPTRFTSKAVLAASIMFLRKLGRIPIVVKDSPGFLVNRMFLPYLNQAILMAREGFSREAIDSAMLEFGMPMGPFQVLKQIGEGVAHKAIKILEDVQGLALNSSCSRLSLEQGGIAAELLRPMKKQAELCLKEEVAASREIIDLALLLGIGFPRSKRIWDV